MSKKLTSFLALFLAFAMVVTGVPANVAYAVENEPEIENEIEEEIEEISEDDEEAVEPEESSDEKNDDEEIEEIIVENEPEEAEAEVKLVDAGFYNTWDDTTWDDSYDGIGEFIVNADFDAFEEGTVIEDNRHEYNVEVPLINETFWNSQYSGSDIWGNDFALSFKKDGEDVLIKNGKTVRVTLNLGEAVPKSGVEKIICEDTQGGSIKQCVSNVEYRLYRAQKNTEGKYDISPVEIHKISDGTITFETQTADYFMLRAVSSGDITYRLNHFNGKDRKPEGGYVDQKDIGNYCDGGLNIEINGDNILRQQEWDTNPTAFYVQNGNLNITGSGSLDLDGQRIIANREPEPDDWRYRGTVTIDGDGSDLSLTNVGDVLGTIKVLGKETKLEAEFSDKPDCGDLYIYDGTVKVTGAGYSEDWNGDTYVHNIFNEVCLFGGNFSLKQSESSIEANNTIPLIGCLFMGDGEAIIEGNVCINEIHPLGTIDYFEAVGPFYNANLTINAEETAVLHRFSWYGGNAVINSKDVALGTHPEYGEYSNATIYGGNVKINADGTGAKMPISVQNIEGRYRTIPVTLDIASKGVGVAQSEYGNDNFGLKINKSDAKVTVVSEDASAITNSANIFMKGISAFAGDSKADAVSVDVAKNPGDLLNKKYVVLNSGANKKVCFISVENGKDIIKATNSTVKTHSVVPKISDPIRTGYEFKGWYLSRDCSGEEWNFAEDEITDNTDFFAKWQANTYTISFDSDGGTHIDDVEVAYDSQYGALSTPTKEGNAFLGWYTAKDGGTKVEESTIVKVTGDQTLYAHWERAKYTVHVHAMGGKVDGEDNKDIEVLHGDALFDASNKPVVVDSFGKKNSRFLGWYTDKTYVTPFTETVATAEVNEVDIYAKWKLDYTVNVPVITLEDGAILTEGSEMGKVKPNSRITIDSTITRNGVILPNEEMKVQYSLDDGEHWSDYTEDVILESGGKTNKTYNVKAKVINSVEGESDVESGTVEYIMAKDVDWGDIEEAVDRDKWLDYAYNVPKGLWVGVYTDEVDFTGKPITLSDIRVYNYKTLLTEGTDYTVKYANNTKAGTASFTITGKGNIGGSLTKTFTINKINLGTGSSLAFGVSVSPIEFAYTGKAQLGKPVITYDTGNGVITLKEKTDYILEYPNTNKKAADYDADAFCVTGNHDITVKGVGNYEGTIIVTETIYPKLIKNAKGSFAQKAYAYDGGNPVEPEPIVKDGKVTLEKDVHYTITGWTNNVTAGTASVTIAGVESEGYYGTATYNFTITGYDIKNIGFTGDAATLFKSGIVRDEYGADLTSTIDTMIEADGAATYKKSKKETVNLVGEKMTKAAFDADPDPDLDFIYEYSTASPITEIGTYTVTFTGVNEYTGSVTKTFKVTGVDISKFKVDRTLPNLQYDGSAKEPIVTKVYQAATKKTPEIVVYLDEDGDGNDDRGVDDCAISYENNVNASGKKTPAYIVVTGKNNCTGTVKIPFNIVPKTLGIKSGKVMIPASDIHMDDIDDVIFTKAGAKPSVTIGVDANLDQVIDGLPLVEGRDYTLKYANNTAIGTADAKKAPTVTITGIGNYSGSITKTFNITQGDISATTIKVGDVVAANKAGICKPAITITDTDGGVLKAKTDYNANIEYFYNQTVEVTQVVKVGKQTVTKTFVRTLGDAYDPKDIIAVGTQMKAVVTGAGNYRGDTHIEGTFKYVTADLAKAKVTIPNQYYTGEAITLNKSDIKVMNGKAALEPTDYTIVGYSNNTNKGKATVTLKGVGNYGGTINVAFNIVARPTNFTIVYEKYFNDEDAALTNPAGKPLPVSGTMKNGSVANGGKIAKCAYKRPEFTFDGWIFDPDGLAIHIPDGGVLNLPDTVALGSEIHLYPDWDD